MGAILIDFCRVFLIFSPAGCGRNTPTPEILGERLGISAPVTYLAGIGSAREASDCDSETRQGLLPTLGEEDEQSFLNIMLNEPFSWTFALISTGPVSWPLTSRMRAATAWSPLVPAILLG
jgi:hypothetical protein